MVLGGKGVARKVALILCKPPHPPSALLSIRDKDFFSPVILGGILSTLSEGLVHSTVHHHLRQLSVYLQSGALIFISELPGVV